MPDKNMTVSAGHEPATPASTWQPDLVIYHDKCADGIVAAWACWKRWGDEPEYRAANYGYEPPADVEGKNILIVDFSYPADDLRGMVAAGCKSIVILDHHKTAQEALHEFAVGEYREAGSVDDFAAILEDLEQFAFDPIVPFFDMNRSGARMAWDFAFPGLAVPRLVELAERYDLWRFTPGTMDHAEILHLAIQAGDMTIARMDVLDACLIDGDGPLIEGAAIYDWRTQLVAEIASRAHVRTVAGVEGVISVECPYLLVSAVGHHLLDKHPAAPFAAMSVTGEKAVTWSLRSRDDRTDVSAVAKSRGGGGHRNAAGFRVELPTPPTEVDAVDVETSSWFPDSESDVVNARHVSAAMSRSVPT
jgi:oligoribonuclease NrnB/cAMP/cGMP phosphodiesterase (DHH superfamily)